MMLAVLTGVSLPAQGEMHTKVFHEERERPIFILVEQSAQCTFLPGTGCFKSVLAAQIASSFLGRFTTQ